jgi:hypothetical protein
VALPLTFAKPIKVWPKQKGTSGLLPYKKKVSFIENIFFKHHFTPFCYCRICSDISKYYFEKLFDIYVNDDEAHRADLIYIAGTISTYHSD